jgi:hypothetical protein
MRTEYGDWYFLADRKVCWNTTASLTIPAVTSQTGSTKDMTHMWIMVTWRTCNKKMGWMTICGSKNNAVLVCLRVIDDFNDTQQSSTRWSSRALPRRPPVSSMIICDVLFISSVATPFHNICILFFTCIGRIWLYFGAMIALAGAEKRKKRNWTND